MKRLEIHISYSCNNKCIFCSEHDRLQCFMDHEININDLLNLLEAKRREGYNHVNFTGGEPTLYNDFEKLLKTTKDLGYKIYIGSNGSFWEEQKNCDRFLPLIDEASLSLHGSNSRVHDEHTQNMGSFEKIISAFKNINDYINLSGQPLYFLCNSVITNKNVDDYGNILNLLVGFKNLNQVLVSNIAPEGSAFDVYKDLAVPYTEFRDKVPLWIQLANEKNIIIRFFGLPLCVLGESSIYANDLNWDERVTFELGKDGEAISLKEKETRLDRNREKIVECKGCTYFKLCGGIFSRYLEIFGPQEIINFKNQLYV